MANGILCYEPLSERLTKFPENMYVEYRYVDSGIPLIKTTEVKYVPINGVFIQRNMKVVWQRVFDNET